MNLEGKEKLEITELENLLLKELDKGIDSMENGRTVPHDKAMQTVRENLKNHCI